MIVVKQALRWAQDFLGDRFVAELLLAHVVQLSREQFIINEDLQLTVKQWQDFQLLVQRHKDGEPVAYILGVKSFWKHDFVVTPACLIPRPDTECLLEWVLHNFPENKCLRVLEIGTGSGAIACSLACARSGWKFVATDISVQALEIARRNAGKLNICNIDFVCSDLFANIGDARFDLIISNPPYIAPNDEHLPDLKYEPQLALVADNSGYDVLFKIITNAKKHMHSGASLILEHGYQQSETLTDFLCKNSYVDIAAHKDYSKNWRFVTATKK